MKQKQKPLLPVDIPLPERVFIEEGVMFVTLRTLDELEQFWTEHKDQFEFACGNDPVDGDPCFLREYEWVFGKSKSAIIRAVMRWGKSDIGCEFYNWKEHEPEWYEIFFQEREEERSFLIETGEWSEQDEAEYRADCARRNPDNYRGWWRYCNLPAEHYPHEWYNPCPKREELINPDMPLAEVTEKLHEQMFDDWMYTEYWAVRTYDWPSIEETIRYWRCERAEGSDYYGRENEAESK